MQKSKYLDALALHHLMKKWQEPVKLESIRQFSVTDLVVVDALLVLARREPAEGQRAAVLGVGRHQIRGRGH